MPPKKTEGAAAATKKASHPSYQDMITEAIVALKERNGSSRQALKKYVKANNQINVVSDTMFDSLFNKALRAGVEKGHFEQPKGPSGGTKLAKKAPKKEEKKTAPKKAAEKKEAKEPKEKKAAAPKKAAAEKKETKKPAAKKADKPAAISKTKTGRVTKTEAKKPAAKKAAAKKDEAKAEPAAASA
ncbi:Histone H1 [Colletotrichum sp. SAR 10_96]|nr:Histone H1 [Colletotrichum sp. SAR 10_96]